ncbi:MAG TPA: amidohydrolase family protein, partial [Lachnospiraceae bacterium]|nr:amidohydrolase family protein [Lachnospiraceae bacterium]
AAELQAVSADHLLMISEQGILDLAQSSTIATLLPCTAFCLNQPYAPARKMIDAGCAVALASDYNPGSSFTNSIPLLFALSAIQMKLSLEEILCALTLNGAAAIKKSKEIGSIEPGKRADLVVLSVPQYEFLVYHTCKNMVYEVIKDGKSVYKNTEPELMGEKE